VWGARLKGCTGSPGRKGEGARKDLKKAYWKLISITQASCAQATEVVEALRDHTVGAAEGLLEGFQRFVPLDLIYASITVKKGCRDGLDGASWRTT
jgi:hypothetical protein